MRYQRCTSFDSGYCYNIGLRNGLNTLGCVGYDRCEAYETDKPLNRSDKTQTEPESSNKGQMTSRVDIVGSNGNDGSHYLVEKVARAIAGDRAEQKLGDGKLGWELFIPNAMRVLEALDE